MSAKRRFRHRKQKMMQWKNGVVPEDIMLDQEAKKLFSCLADELQRATKIREECDITQEIIGTHRNRFVEIAKLESKVRYISVQLLAVYMVFCGLTLLLYAVLNYYFAVSVDEKKAVCCIILGLLFLMFFEWKVNGFYRVLEREEEK